MIVKIQRPLMSNEETPMVLVYNRSRRFEAHMPMTPEIEAMFEDGSLKIYCKARLVGDSLLIGRRLYGETDW